MLGSLKLKVGKKKNKHFTVYGGPYKDKPEGYFGVRMAAEIPLPAEVVIPTVDFSVPNKQQLMDGLYKTVQAIAKGKAVYVGCMGGRGRTGLFLAALCKLWGEHYYVRYVRKHYFSHAVETAAQYRYVKKLKFPRKLRLLVAWTKFNAHFTKRLALTDKVLIVAKLAHPWEKIG